MTELKQVTHGPAQIEYGTEKPRYRALERAIAAYYRDLLRPLEALHQKLEMVLGLPRVDTVEPTADDRKYAEELVQAGRHKEQSRPIVIKEADPFTFNRSRQRQVDAAIDTFLEALAGPDRSEEGFIKGGIESDTPDGIIQQHNILSFATGLQRGSDLVSQEQTVTAARNNPATEKMLENAFARLSESGQLRLEQVRDELHGILAGAAEAGLGPLDTARQLSAQFDEYSRYEFQRLARTEAAYASEEGVREQLQAYGVTAYEWLVDASACPVCQGYVGQVIAADDVENLPPAHPNCLCTVSPAGIGEMML